MATGVLRKIFSDQWESFVAKHGERVRPVVKKEIRKMLDCGKIGKGYIEFTCQKCGEQKKVGMRCRSRFCTSCGKVYIDDRAENMSEKLIQAKHRHMVFTIAEELRIYFRQDRKLLEILPRVAAKVIQSWLYEQNHSEEYKAGVVAVIHTFGRDLKWNPHVHVLMTEGATGKKTAWKRMNFIPYKMLRMRWQKLLLDEIKQRVRGSGKVINQLYKANSEGFYVYGKGEIKNEKSAIQYVGRYTGRPPVAESKIIGYDGENVTFWYVRHEDDKKVTETISAEEFISRLIVHIHEQHFKTVRYYGIYCNSSELKFSLIKMVKETVKRFRRRCRNWRTRIMKSFGYDPIECQKCHHTMEIADVVIKGKSVLGKYREKIMYKYAV